MLTLILPKFLYGIAHLLFLELSGYQDEKPKLISQQYRAWSDCTDVQVDMVLWYGQRLITFASSSIWIIIGIKLWQYRNNLSTVYITQYSNQRHWFIQLIIKNYSPDNLKLNLTYILSLQTRHSYPKIFRKCLHVYLYLNIHKVSIFRLFQLAFSKL